MIRPSSNMIDIMIQINHEQSETRARARLKVCVARRWARRRLRFGAGPRCGSRTPRGAPPTSNDILIYLFIIPFGPAWRGALLLLSLLRLMAAAAALSTSSYQ